MVAGIALVSGSSSFEAKARDSISSIRSDLNEFITETNTKNPAGVFITEVTVARADPVCGGADSIIVTGGNFDRDHTLRSFSVTTRRNLFCVMRRPPN